jgi:iron complex outermembrane recepter protein
LRGPQGALYGRNAVGGAINIISAKPTETFDAEVDGLTGDFGRWESDGHVSGPLGIANTDARISYQIKYFDGYTKNLYAGPEAPSRQDDLGADAFRAQTLTHLAGGGSFGVIFTHYLEQDAGPAMGVKPYDNIVYPSQALYGATPTPNPRYTYANVGANHINTSDLNLYFQQPLGRYNLSSVFNYRASERNWLYDCDGTSAIGCTETASTSSKEIYGDIHISSPDDDRLRWLIGATGMRFPQAQDIVVHAQSLESYFNPAAPTTAPFPLDVFDGGSVTTKSYAAYSDVRLRLNSIWAVTGQLRYSETTKSAVQHYIIPAFGIDSVDYIGPGSYLKNVSLPFKMLIEGQITPQALVYASYTTAEKDGAINLGLDQPTPVKKETVRNSEIGEKITFFDRRLAVNSALFVADYSDLQISQITVTSTILANAPRSKIKGAELEVVGIPVTDLQLSLNAGYLDAKFEEFSNSPTLPGLIPGPFENLAGHYLPYVAPISANADAAYKIALAGSYAASFDLQYSWHARVYFNEFNNYENSQGPVGLLNLSASLAPEAGPWRVYGYVHNLTDVTVATGSTIYSGPLGATKAVSFAPPRLFGIGASYSWR